MTGWKGQSVGEETLQGTRMLKRGRDYRETYDGFRWEVPRLYNIGVDVCDGSGR